MKKLMIIIGCILLAGCQVIQDDITEPACAALKHHPEIINSNLSVIYEGGICIVSEPNATATYMMRCNTLTQRGLFMFNGLENETQEFLTADVKGCEIEKT